MQLCATPELRVVPGLVWSPRGFFQAHKKKGTVLSAAWDRIAEFQTAEQGGLWL